MSRLTVSEMPNIKTIYFDESGNTGPNLLDPQQKFFSVGSTDLNESEAHAILARHFPNHIGTDIKFKKLFRDPSNHADLIRFAETVGQQPLRFFCLLMDKKFALLCRLFDWLVEPVFRKQGRDWYKNDYAASFMNICHLAFILPEDNEKLLTEITGLYADFIRAPSINLLEKMRRRYRELAATGPTNVAKFMGFVAEGADRFEEFYKLDDLKDHIDIHVAALVASVAWWRSRHSADFRIVHDASTYFFKRQDLWKLITSMAAKDIVVVIGDNKSIKFPLRVTSTSEGLSEKLASLQICDLIGGYVARSKSDKLSTDQQRVIEMMFEAGFKQIGFDSVEPGNVYAEDMPPLADGPDAVDQIAMAVRKS